MLVYLLGVFLLHNLYMEFLSIYASYMIFKYFYPVQEDISYLDPLFHKCMEILELLDKAHLCDLAG